MSIRIDPRSHKAQSLARPSFLSLALSPLTCREALLGRPLVNGLLLLLLPATDRLEAACMAARCCCCLLLLAPLEKREFHELESSWSTM